MTAAAMNEKKKIRPSVKKPQASLIRLPRTEGGGAWCAEIAAAAGAGRGGMAQGRAAHGSSFLLR